MISRSPSPPDTTALPLYPMNATDQNSPDKYDLPKAYEFTEVERRWYTRWLEEKSFSARMNEGKPSFSIVIPPPNVTGVLHIGHALNNTLQDILTATTG
jgi:valyl-tRNA synthetase